MNRKVPRNYRENRSVTAATKLSSDTYSWLSNHKFLAHLSISRILYNIVEFTRAKESEFIQYIDEHDKNH